MSIALAVKKDKQVVIGADTQQNFGQNTPCDGNLNESKILRIDSGFLASTSWGLYGNILDDYLSGKKTIQLKSRMDVFHFFMGFWQALHSKYSFVNDQCADKESPFGDIDASFLIVTKDKIFHVSSDMSVSEFLKFHAIGSGSNYAIGAMHVLFKQKLSAEEIARQAIEAAIAHNIYCGGNIEIMEP